VLACGKTLAKKDSQAILLPFIVFMICFHRFRQWTKRARNLAWSGTSVNSISFAPRPSICLFDDDSSQNWSQTAPLATFQEASQSDFRKVTGQQ
jgi:hypothetical protein